MAGQLSTDRALQFDTRLVEDAVLHRVQGGPDEARLHAERDRVYSIEDAEQREAAFQGLHGRWFAALDLARPIVRALQEVPAVLGAVDRCVVALARRATDEGAELCVRSDDQVPSRNVLLLLRPGSLSDPDALLTLLRHELLHVADMLDPGFGYRPSVSDAGADPSAGALLVQRYTALWDCAVDGRLEQRGLAARGARQRRREQLARAFPMLAELEAEAVFRRMYDRAGDGAGGAITHLKLVLLATNPRGRADGRVRPGSLPGGSERDPRPAVGLCTLCRLPTFALAHDARGLEADVVSAVRADYPWWDPSCPVCLQCADLYRARCATGRPPTVSQNPRRLPALPAVPGGSPPVRRC